MLRNLEQIQYAKESRFTCQFWSNVRKSNRFDRIHLDLAFLHPISAAHPYL